MLNSVYILDFLAIWGGSTQLRRGHSFSSLWCYNCSLWHLEEERVCNLLNKPYLTLLNCLKEQRPSLILAGVLTPCIGLLYSFSTLSLYQNPDVMIRSRAGRALSDILSFTLASFQARLVSQAITGSSCVREGVACETISPHERTATQQLCTRNGRAWEPVCWDSEYP